MKQRDSEVFEPPDFEIAGLQVWIRGRPFADAQGYWDANWLDVLVHCGAVGADVWTGGHILHLGDVAEWLRQIVKLNSELSGAAQLPCIEPNLAAKLELKDGRGSLVVRITPDYMAQKHEFTFAVDQSYLRELIASLERLFQRYPIRGHP